LKSRQQVIGHTEFSVSQKVGLEDRKEARIQAAWILVCKDCGVLFGSGGFHSFMVFPLSFFSRSCFELHWKFKHVSQNKSQRNDELFSVDCQRCSYLKRLYKSDIFTLL